MKSFLTQKGWVRIGKILANENRLKILRILWSEEEKDVTTIARELKISVNSTSRNLVMMERQGILEGTGKQSHVFYRIAKDMTPIVKDVLTTILIHIH